MGPLPWPSIIVRLEGRRIQEILAGKWQLVALHIASIRIVLRLMATAETLLSLAPRFNERYSKIE
jgi:hypothetical protein